MGTKRSGASRCLHSQNELVILSSSTSDIALSEIRPPSPFAALPCHAANGLLPSRSFVWAASCETPMFAARGWRRRIPWQSLQAAARVLAWRTPLLILLCGCLIATIGFGPRSSLGLFLTPMSTDRGWGRDIFALAMAIQVLMWGVGQPIAGAIADRFGVVLVLCGGAILYAIGLGWMAYATTPNEFYLSAGCSRRLRHCRMLLQHRPCGLRQADAAALALAFIRPRHCGGLVRPISVLAAGDRLDRRLRLADRRW